MGIAVPTRLGGILPVNPQTISHLIPPTSAVLQADSPPVNRSDIVQISVSNPGFGNVQAGNESGFFRYFGVAAEPALPGQRFRVWRGGYYPVRIMDGQVLPAATLLSWEGTAARWVQVTDFAVIGRTLEPTSGAVGQIAMCELWWPMVIRWT